jgi:hypothetical protein
VTCNYTMSAFYHRCHGILASASDELAKELYARYSADN